jgi:hypothetical protein
MAFKMSYSSDKLEGPKPQPAGLYTVAFIGFKPKKSEDGGSLNLNGMAKIVNQADLKGPGLLFVSLNSQIPSFIQDFVHSFGLEMDDQNGDTPTIPGDFDGDQNDPTTWKYTGPLSGQTAQWEIGLKPHYKNPGEVQQEMIKFICKVPQCAERFPKVKHAKDMRKKG